MDGQRIQVPLDRSDFESLCGDLVDRTMMTTRKALREADRTWKDVSRLLLVGGSSRMPMVQNMLEAESGLKMDCSLSADESVADGAAIYAGILLSTDQRLNSKITVHNVNSHDLGLLGLDKDTGGQRRSLMIPRNTRLPTKKGKRFSTSRPNQSSVSVKVVEGGDDNGRHSTLIGNCLVRDLPANLPAATPVDVFFNYGEDGRLHVAATLPSVGKTASLTIERESGLTKDELVCWSERIESGLLNETSIMKKPEPMLPKVSPIPGSKATPASPKVPNAPAQTGSTPDVKPGGGWKSRRQQVKPGDTE